MNESTNPGSPKERGWPVIRKAQIIGASIGAIGTIVLLSLGGILNNAEGSMFDFFGTLAFLLGLPSYLVLKLFGYESLIGGNRVVIALCICASINALLFFILGTCVGWLSNKYRDAKKSKSE